MMTKKDGDDFRDEKHDDSGYAPEWGPADLEFPNALDLDLKEAPLRVTQLGTMLMWIRTSTCNGTFSQALELKHFPFDRRARAVQSSAPCSLAARRPDAVRSLLIPPLVFVQQCDDAPPSPFPSPQRL